MLFFKRQTLAEAREEFRKIIDAELHPLLTERGFIGQRPNWRRMRGPVVNCVQLQHSKYHDTCCVNLGVHFAFLPMKGDETSLEKIEPCHCALSRRLKPDGNYKAWWEYPLGDYWWKYRRPQKTARELIRAFSETSENWFGPLADFPRPFSECDSQWLTDHINEPDFSPQSLALLVQIHQHLGHHVRAMEACRIGSEFKDMRFC